MKLVIFEDIAAAANFYPISLSRPVFEMRCGIFSLAEKIARRLQTSPSAYLCRSYLTTTFKRRTGTVAVNDLAGVKNDTVLMVNGQVKACSLNVVGNGPSEIGMKGEQVVYVRLADADTAKIDAAKIGVETAAVGRRARHPGQAG